MHRIKLIVQADEPAIFYSSLAVAEADMEAIDVNDGVYQCAFGPNGEPYSIYVEDDMVKIRPTMGEPQPQEVRRIIENFLKVLGIRGDYSESLEELLIRCSPFVE